MVHEVALATADVWIVQFFVNLQWFGFYPFAVFPVETFLCDLADVDFWVEVCCECVVVVTCIAVNDVEIVYFVEMMLCCIGGICLRNSWVEAAAKDCCETSFFKLVFVGPLP